MELFISVIFMIAGTLWIGVLITAFLGKLIVSLLPRYREGKWPRNAVEAEAIVLKMEATGLYINKLPQVKLQVQVQPDLGRNFVAEISIVFSSHDQETVKTGGLVRVRYNPHNYRELLLVRVA